MGGSTVRVQPLGELDRGAVRSLRTLAGRAQIHRPARAPRCFGQAGQGIVHSLLLTGKSEPVEPPRHSRQGDRQDQADHSERDDQLDQA